MEQLNLKNRVSPEYFHCIQGRRQQARGLIRNTFTGPHSVTCVETLRDASSHWW